MLVSPDLAIQELAARQQGVFTRKQASALGLSPAMIQYRLTAGRWRQLHPGIYCHGSAVDGWLLRQAAATYWSQGAAAGRAAGRLNELPGCDDAPLEVITTAKHKVMPRCGIVVHLTNRLPHEQLTMRNGMPCTTIERTLLDLCGIFDPRKAAIAIDNALYRGLTTTGSLDHCLYLTARRGRNGCGVMRKLLRPRLSLTEAPNSPLETVIFEMICSAGLPMPELQYVIRDYDGTFVARPDFVYPNERIVIEGHSNLWHSGEFARTADARRDANLRATGFLPVYLSWRDATVEKQRTVRMLRRILFPPDAGGLQAS